MGWPTQLRCCGLLKYTVLVPSCRHWNINFFHQQYLRFRGVLQIRMPSFLAPDAMPTA